MSQDEIIENLKANAAAAAQEALIEEMADAIFRKAKEAGEKLSESTNRGENGFLEDCWPVGFVCGLEAARSIMLCREEATVVQAAFALVAKRWLGSEVIGRVDPDKLRDWVNANKDTDADKDRD